MGSFFVAIGPQGQTGLGGAEENELMEGDEQERCVLPVYLLRVAALSRTDIKKRSAISRLLYFLILEIWILERRGREVFRSSNANLSSDGLTFAAASRLFTYAPF
jgi:hypothetical protein